MPLCSRANLVLMRRQSVWIGFATRRLGIFTAMDVADTAQCIALMEEAERQFGSVDILINNAGMHSRGDVEKVPVDDRPLW